MWRLLARVIGGAFELRFGLLELLMGFGCALNFLAISCISGEFSDRS